MMKLVLLVVQVVSVFCLPGYHSQHEKDHGAPLFLTPYIESGNITQGQEAARVNLITSGGEVKGYSGYFTVNKAYNSNMFFWFFPAEEKPESAPVVLWLQGGPGATSLFGLFTENGPIFVNKSGGLGKRSHYWSQVFNLIYIDNPVGTGFSFTDNDNGYVRDEVGVGRDLYSALKQFFQLFPLLQKNEFFVTGESYAGKYVPAIAYTIHQNNPSSSIKINLKGISIGNGLCDPVHMLGYSDYLFQIGLIDSNTRDIIKIAEDDTRDLISKEKWVEAFEGFDKILNGDLTPYHTLFYNATRFNFYFNYLYSSDNNPYGDMDAYLQSNQVRKLIHVGGSTWHTDNKVETNLREDVMQSVKPWVEILLENYRVLIYNGQLDIIVAYPLTVNFINSLNWSGAGEYKTAPRKPWYVGDDLAGYSKTVKGFTEVLVRNAGHMVPMDQPQWALDLIQKFTMNVPL